MPNNATLVVSGDFDPAEAKAIIATYYGPLPRRQLPPVRPAPLPSMMAQVVVQHRETRGRSPRLYYAWHTPPRFDAEQAAGEVTAMLLGGLEASRLYMGLPQAVLVGAHQQDLLAGSTFHVMLEPRAGVSMESLHRKAETVIGLLRTHAPSAPQVEAAVRRILAARFVMMEDSLHKAQLAAEIVSFTGTQEDPIAFEKKRYLAVTPEDVRRFAQRHLTSQRQVVVFAATENP